MAHIPNSRKYLTLDTLKSLIKETSKAPETFRDPRDAKNAKLLQEITDKYEDDLIEIYYELLCDSINLVHKRLQAGDYEIIQEGFKKMLRFYTSNIINYLNRSSEIVLFEGYKIYVGDCDICDSKTCPMIKLVKPDQYDEKMAKKKLTEITDGEIRAIPLSKDFFKKLGIHLKNDLGLKELASKLGISEEELRKHIKDSVEKE